MTGITTKPLTYYCDSDAAQKLIQRYGDQLEEMAFDSLLAFNAVISTYLLYYNFAETGEPVSLTFKIAVNQVWNGWREKDPEAYEYCKQVCTTSNSSTLAPLVKGLAEAIQCHRDY